MLYSKVMPVDRYSTYGINYNADTVDEGSGDFAIKSEDGSDSGDGGEGEEAPEV